MEKLLYLLWRDEGDANAFAERLRTRLAPELQRSSARRLQLNVVDRDVEPAAGLRQERSIPAIDAMLTFWLPTAFERGPLEERIIAFAGRAAGYVVCESEPIANVNAVNRVGERTDGFSQIAVLQRPPRLAREQWLDIWLNSHTKVAIETQSTFRYVQNVVVQSLTCAAPGYDAVVEECFPAAAMTDQQAFYDAVGDDEKYRRNLQAMMESCTRFIDFDKIDVVPTSEYRFYVDD